MSDVGEMGTLAPDPLVIQSHDRPFHKNLEAMRGIAAAIVVLHHLSLNPGSLLASVSWLQQGWLFVDLFFVLSGYVIASVHAEAEASADAAKRFLIRRFFRLWPLHFATLLAALAVDVQSGKAQQSGYALMVGMNLTLTHAWGLTSGGVLNGPSWSISTEWAAYLIFAWICLATPSRSRRLQLLGAAGLISFVSLIVWRDASLDGDLALRVPRCTMSFALGAAVWGSSRNWRATDHMRAGILQASCAAGIIALLSLSAHEPRLTLLMPLLSAAMIAAMVLDGGSTVRRALERPVPQWLGRCSYSLYLVHMPLFRLLLLATPGGWPTRPLTINAWICAALVILFAVASLTNILIEKPCREFGRNLAKSRLGSGSEWSDLEAA